MTPALLNNRYRIIQNLAAGGFGETFLAEDTHLPSRRRCVIKQLKPIQNNPETYQFVQERFQREAVILEQLGETSQQIPQLYAYFSEHHQFYLVQELIAGVTLSQKVQQERYLNESAVREILSSLLSVLDYIHAKGVIHRDIKPNNIILRQQDNQPVLIDFGAAKETMTLAVNSQGEFTSSIAIGTRGYMPPEQAVGKPVFASDIYSLGMTAVYLLTGKSPQNLPLNGETGALIWQQYCLTPVSSGFAAIIDRAIEMQVGDRFESAKVMLAALETGSPLFSHPAETTAAYSRLATTEPPVRSIASPPQQRAARTKVPYSKQGDGATHRPEGDRYRQILLNKVKNYWIKGVLETSLHGKALIELGLEARLDAVDRPWGMAWETPDQPQQPLPPGTKVIDKFDEMGEGRTLLILGEPGSGKTITLLELCRDLLVRAEQENDQPIPVVFNLSSWTNSRQVLADWIVQELYTKYQVAKEISQKWIQQQRLLLLLDGLDEVNLQRRELCVQAVNNFCRDYGHTEIVICSRIQDYEALSSRLQLQGAICIQPLTLEQVKQYFANTGSELLVVSQALAEDPTLQALAKSPLMLSIMMLAYQRISADAFPKIQSLEKRHQHLFNAYIERMFSRRSSEKRYAKRQAKHWLIWLAKRMVKESQTIFLIERIQPDWLPKKRQQSAYASAVMLSFFIISGILGNFVLHFDKLIPALIIGGICFGLIFGVTRISPSPTLQWSSKRAKESLPLGLAIAPLFGLVLKLAFAFGFDQVTSDNIQWLFSLHILPGFIFGLTFGLILVLIRGLTGPGIETVTIPNQGIWQSAKNSIIFALLGLFVPGLIAWLLKFYLPFWLTFGLSFGLIAGGGEACIKHFILRLILYCSGHIPWNYARFLDYATERIFLQKVGGGYIFIHRSLLEHFAQMPLEESSSAEL